MEKCKGCGAEIVFVKMKSGKSMPCDPEPTPYWEKRGGETKVVTQDGLVVSGDISRMPHGHSGEATGVGYIPHWATCPAANQFRKKAEG